MSPDGVRLGDEGEFDAVVEAHTPGLYRLAYRLTGNAQDAEDVVQETFVRAYGRLDRYQDDQHLAAWLRRAASNRAIDLLRRRGRWGEGGHDGMDRRSSTLPGPERDALGAEVRRRVEATLGELTPRERTAFVLRHVEGCSIEEISRVLGTATSATKNHVFRAVKKMRRALGPLVESAT